jgi:hypothetical protein
MDQAVVRHDDIRPHGVDELVLADEPIAVIYEIDERVEGSRRERHCADAGALQDAGSGIEREIPERVHAG